MERIDALKAMLVKVDAGKYDETADRPKRFNEFCNDWENARGVYTDPSYSSPWKAYRGSLDAAKALHEAVFPEYSYQWHLSYEVIYNGFVCSIFGCKQDCHVSTSFYKDPARAWLIAILKALISEAEE